ncbi:MAG: hypothetical protein ACI9MR_003735 [Myxococcota bacterium]|jgi:hypothetical protein
MRASALLLTPTIGQLVQGAKPVGDVQAPPKQPTVTVDHPDPFAHAVAAARGELSSAPTSGAGGRDVDDVVGPTPLVDHPDTAAALRDGIHAALRGKHEGDAPTDLATVKRQAWDLVQSAVAQVTKAVAKPSTTSADPEPPEA